jgi:hypothetical protein
MKARLDFSIKQVAPRLVAVVALLAAAIALAGCDTFKPHLPEVRYRPTNVYIKSKTLDPQIKRVAVLPLTTSLPTESLLAGVDLLQPLVRAELEKTKRFELLIVSAEQLRQWTGHGSWKVDDQLPADFFDRLHDAGGCDAVFFTELTRYQAYPPLAVGWKLTLVQNTPRDILWSADEVFDAGDTEIANAARHYSTQHVHVEAPLADPESILGSPSRFGQYTLNALLTLLPLR